MPSSSGLSTNQKTAPNGGAFFSERPDSDLILDSRANALDESQTMFNSDSLGFQSDNPAAAQNREFPRLLSVQTDQVIVSPFQSTSTRKMDTAKPSTIPVVDGPLHVSDIAANHKEYFKPYLHQVNSDPGELDKQNRENAQSSSDLPQCRPAQSSVVSSYPDKPALLGQEDQDIPETTKQQDILHYKGSSPTQTLINSLQSSNGNEKVITFPAPLSQSTTNPVSDVLRINGSHSGATRPHSSEFIPSVTLPYSPSTPEEFLTPSVDFFQNQRPSEFHFPMPSVPLSSPKGRQESPMEAHAQHQEQQDQHQQSQNSQQKEQRKPQAPRPFRRQLSKRKNEVPLEEMENDMEMESRRLGLLMPRTSVDTPSDEDSDEDDEDFFSLPSISPRTPTSPWPRRKEPYDPYQIFEVLHTPCLILTVTVIRGRNITMGFQDLYDTPDPFLKLVMKSSPEGKKWTTVKTDQTNPIWNETFTFFVNFQQANVLEINLMEYNSLWFNQLVGTVYFDLVNINEIGVRQLETFVFNGISQVDIEFLLEFDRNPTLRYSLCLSDQEKEFIQRRKEKVFSAMKKFLGEQDGPACVQEVPTIAVIGSGGGFRAMTAYSGVFKALLETGILDCSTYVCGLSGSSWFLSTLYSHPQWPHNLDMSDFLDEIKNKMDKKLTRFLNASTLYTFYKIMVEKRKERQPVSFTDIFGRMVGETLIPDRMEATLTDQREKIKEGASPMPLYTCVHVKKDVPARSFQEWVEFSPYEIGMPKYGTFMDSALFGSKFFMGKLVKEFKEQPLHFLQGIWGSAFCILFKRLFEDNSRIDPAEMLREQLQEQLVEDSKNSSSDCSDDDDDDGDDTTDSDGGSSSADWSSMDSDVSSVKFVGTSDQTDHPIDSASAGKEERKARLSSSGNENKSSSQDLGSDEEINGDSGRHGSTGRGDGDSAYEDESDDEEEEDEEEEMADADSVKPGILKNIRKGSLEKKLVQKQLMQLQASAAENGIDEPDAAIGRNQPSSAFFSGVPGNIDQSEGLKKSVNWGACPTRHEGKSKATEQRRLAYQRASSSMRKSRSGSKSYWKGFIKSLVDSNSWEILHTRQGRAAVIHNFMRGLNLQQTYPISPFTPVDQRVKKGDEFDEIFEMHSTSVKHIYMVDAGLTFNSPFPLVLRPQRQVDIILSFDFSARSSDSHQPFKELLLAEKWAKLNRLPFPPIDTSVFERDGMKELYIFRHPTDPHCPIVFHFTLVNKTFRDFSAPGVPRKTEEETEFANFDIFDDPNAPYSTFNFTYTHESFDRLSKLTEFNTLLHIEDIRQVMTEVVTKKRVGPPRVPIQSKDIKLLRMKSVQEMRKLRKFITRMESRSSIFSASSRCGSSGRGSIPSNFFPHSPLVHLPGPRNHTDSVSSQEGSVFNGSPKDRLACFTSSSFSTSRDISNDLVNHSLPSQIIHRMKQQQLAEQQQHQHQEQEKEKLTNEPRSRLTSTESVYGTPPNDITELKKRLEADITDSSPCPAFVADNSAFGAELSDSDVWNLKSRRLSNINEDSTDSIHWNPSEPHTKGFVSTTRKKPKVIDCTSHSLSMDGKPYDMTLSTASNSISSPGVKHRSPSPSPKLKIPTNPGFQDSEGPPLVNGGKQSGGRSSGSSGVWSMTSGSANSSGSSNSGSGRFTPAVLEMLKKKRVRKESPPNPFFVNAHFMRSTLSSNSSSGSLTISNHLGDENPGKFERGKSYRLSPQPLVSGSQSSLLSSQNKSNQGNVQSISGKDPSLKNPFFPQVESQTSTGEEFSMAAEAFRSDGTPVIDQRLSKMFYESAKDKRKLFRRQSTVSSLNSISLDDKDTPSTNSESMDDIKEEPQDQEDEKNHTRFRDLFLSLENQSSSAENCGTSGSIEQTALYRNISEISNNRYVSINSDKTDSSFDPDIMDLSEFNGSIDTDSIGSESKVTSQDTKMRDTFLMGKNSRESIEPLNLQVQADNTDIWFDAKTCLS